MKIDISAPVLAEALQKCASVIATRSTLPILGCVLIETGDEAVTITASSLDAWAICKIPAKVGKKGSICLDHRTLSKIAAGDGEISIDADAKLKVSISTGASKFRMSGLAGDEFPSAPDNKAEGVNILASDWLTAAARTSPAESQDSTRYMLCGALLSSIDGQLGFVSTNGHCLVKHMTETPWTAADAIVPSATMKAISAICPEDGEITLSVSTSHISAEAGPDRIVSKLIEANYPNYRQVIPDYPAGKSSSIRILPGDLTSAIRTLATVMDSSAGRHVRFATAGTELSAAFTGPEKSAETTVPAVCEGPEVEIGLNPQLLGSLIRPVGSELTISIIDAMSPVRITEGASVIIIMPMRIVA